MLDSISLLEECVCRGDILWIIVPNHLQRTILSIFRFPAAEDSERDLHISILHITASQDEITFQRPDAPNADRIAHTSCINEHDIFQCRAIVDPIVSV